MRVDSRVPGLTSLAMSRLQRFQKPFCCQWADLATKQHASLAHIATNKNLLYARMCSTARPIRMKADPRKNQQILMSPVPSTFSGVRNFAEPKRVLQGKATTAPLSAPPGAAEAAECLAACSEAAHAAGYHRDPNHCEDGHQDLPTVIQCPVMQSSQ